MSRIDSRSFVFDLGVPCKHNDMTIVWGANLTQYYDVRSAELLRVAYSIPFWRERNYYILKPYFLCKKCNFAFLERSLPKSWILL